MSGKLPRPGSRGGVGGNPPNSPTGTAIPGTIGHQPLEPKRTGEFEWKPKSGVPCPPNLASIPAHTSPEKWVKEINGPGMSSPGRNNNCVDCTRAVESTWRGNPEMAAAMDNPNADGTDAGRITEWAGGTFQKATYDEIRAKLESLGDRSSAMIVSAWAGGRGGHAFNAINDGNVKFVDGQSGTVSGWPPVSWSENQTSGSWAVYFDSNGNPV